MPTGYTCDVQSGKVTEFRDFAWQCARAFGALVMLRDDADAPIPKRFEPNTSYYDDRIEDAKKRLLELETMTPDECSKEARALREDELRARDDRKARRAVERKRYEAMLAKVDAWQAPSDEHAEFKSFMAQQLADSIKFDCDDSYDTLSKFIFGDEWRVEQIRKARRDIDYNTAERAKEIERTEGRNRWLSQLREALK